MFPGSLARRRAAGAGRRVLRVQFRTAPGNRLVVRTGHPRATAERGRAREPARLSLLRRAAERPPLGAATEGARRSLRGPRGRHREQRLPHHGGPGQSGRARRHRGDGATRAPRDRRPPVVVRRAAGPAGQRFRRDAVRHVPARSQLGRARGRRHHRPRGHGLLGARRVSAGARAHPELPWHDVAEQLNETVIRRAIAHDLRAGAGATAGCSKSWSGSRTAMPGRRRAAACGSAN